MKFSIMSIIMWFSLFILLTIIKVNDVKAEGRLSSGLFDSYIVAMDYQNNRVVIGDRDGNIRLYDLAEQSSLPLRQNDKTGSLVDVQFVPNSPLVVTAFDNGTIIFIDTINRSEQRVKTNQRELLSLAISSNGQYVAAGTWGGFIVYELSDEDSIIENEVMIPLPSVPGCCTIHAVWSLTFTPDSQSLLTGTTDSVIYLWDIATFTPVELYKGEGIIWNLNYADASDKIVFVDALGTIGVGNTEKFTTINLREDSAKPFVASFLDGIQTIIVGFENGSLRIYDATTGDLLKSVASVAGNDDRIFSLLVLPDSNHVLVGYRSGKVAAWNIESDSELSSLQMFLNN